MRRTRISGFSLIELMMTIAIVAILLAVAFPSFQGAIRSNRVATASNELIATFSLARSEAIRSPGGSGICSSTDGATCGGDWGNGWIVWIDGDGNGAPGGATDRVIRYTVPNPNLTYTSTASAGSTTLIRFDPRGRVVDNVTHTVSLVPTTCPAGLELSRQVGLNATGQARITRDVCS